MSGILEVCGIDVTYISGIQIAHILRAKTSNGEQIMVMLCGPGADLDRTWD